MKINIQQNNIPENLKTLSDGGTEVVTKLYEIALDCTLDSDVRGNILVRAAFNNQLDYLNTKFPNLNITADKVYISFANSTIANKLKDYVGDGVGVTLQDAAAVTGAFGVDRTGYDGTNKSWSFTQEEKDSVTSFNEFRYFTGISSIGNNYVGGIFSNFKNLTSIVLPPNCIIGLDAFRSCSSLTNINLDAIKYLANGGTFRDSNLDNIDVNLSSYTDNVIPFDSFLNTNIKSIVNLPNVTMIGPSAFAGCKKLTTVNLPSSVVELRDRVFAECTSLESINVENITTMGHGCLAWTGKLPKVINFTSLTTLLNVSSTGVTGHLCITNAKHIYVPKLTNTCGGFDSGGSNCRGMFIVGGWSNSYLGAVHIVYFRDLTSVQTGAFNGAAIKNLVVNAVTPPPVTQYYSGGSDTLLNSTVSRSTVTNLYVPDASVTAYQQDLYWGEFGSKIKPISQLNKVATRALFDELTDSQQEDTLIEEYM